MFLNTDAGANPTPSEKYDSWLWPIFGDFDRFFAKEIAIFSKININAIFGENIFEIITLAQALLEKDIAQIPGHDG
jgi:hypothetical protein